MNQYASRHPEGHRQAGEEGQTDIGWIMNFLLIQSIKKEQNTTFWDVYGGFKKGLSFCELKKAKTQLIHLHALLKISSHSLESFMFLLD